MPGFFLGVPDEVNRSVPRHLRGDGDPDILDQLSEYKAGHGGAVPDTWVEFQHGIAHLGRAAAAEKLRIADAVAAHKQKEADWRAWTADHRYLSGGG